ncbi:ABC transporter permease [Kineothrix sedimenti]|uniref:ABC transporter permease subunit n=1 Tax=Kineothrix sedimenti TaxID=3123317 RepID=A0ABZ3ER07_9FIRM
MFGLVCLILFNYIPMIGLQIAFRDFRPGNTIWNAAWVGLDNFWFLRDNEFWRVVKNTMLLTVSRFAVTFPAPIILALLINEVRSVWFKRIVQSITYIPHFISWVVVVYMLNSFLSPYDGLINELIVKLGGSPIYFMGENKWFVPMVVIASVWKEVGWGTIIYLAAITGISQEMYEAAKLDGAGRWNQMRYITLPSIRPTIVLLLILGIPGIINAGVDAVYPLMNNANLEVSTVLDTYVLMNGLQQGRYSFATAVGMVSSVISFLLIVTANKIANAVNGEGLW